MTTELCHYLMLGLLIGLMIIVVLIVYLFVTEKISIKRNRTLPFTYYNIYSITL
jgi:hypothetical protein